MDVVSTFQGMDRRADKFRLVAYPTAKGCAAAYFPEANALVHKENVARESNTPGFKAMFVRFEPHTGNPAAAEEAAGGWAGHGGLASSATAVTNQMISAFVKRDA
ncbi:flagellar basal body rod protein FlgB [Arthrobacter sp. MW3 TE3886]